MPAQDREDGSGNGGPNRTGQSFAASGSFNLKVSYGGLEELRALFGKATPKQTEGTAYAGLRQTAEAW